MCVLVLKAFKTRNFPTKIHLKIPEFGLSSLVLQHNVETMNILEFNQKFPNENACKEYLVDLRLKQGITCKECKTQTKHYYLKSIEKFKCSKCNSRTNLKAGTIMEQSKVSLQKWFMTIHLMTSIKKSFSWVTLIG